MLSVGHSDLLSRQWRNCSQITKSIGLFPHKKMWSQSVFFALSNASPCADFLKVIVLIGLYSTTLRLNMGQIMSLSYVSSEGPSLASLQRNLWLQTAQHGSADKLELPGGKRFSQAHGQSVDDVTLHIFYSLWYHQLHVLCRLCAHTMQLCILECGPGH